MELSVLPLREATLCSWVPGALTRSFSAHLLNPRPSTSRSCANIPGLFLKATANFQTKCGTDQRVFSCHTLVSRNQKARFQGFVVMTTTSGEKNTQVFVCQLQTQAPCLVRGLKCYEEKPPMCLHVNFGYCTNKRNGRI